MTDFEYILQGSQQYCERQSAEIKKMSTSGRSGKKNISSVNTLPSLPGVKTIRKKR